MRSVQTFMCRAMLAAAVAAACGAVPVHAASITIDAPGCVDGGVLTWDASAKAVHCLGGPVVTGFVIATPDCPGGTQPAFNLSASVLHCQIGAPSTPAIAGMQIAVNLPHCSAGNVTWDAATSTLACPVSLVPGSLNADNSVASKYDSLTDGLLILRYMFGLRGDALVAGAISETAQRNDPLAIATYLAGMSAALDVDQSGSIDALTDGMLIVRYMFGMRGTALVGNVVGLTVGNTAALEARIQDLMR